MDERVRVQAHVEGLVQGVGFRPFVHTLATGLGLAGQVGNDGTGVFVEVEGDHAAVAEFLTRLRRDHPPLASVDRVRVTAAPPAGASGFQIAASRPAAPAKSPAGPDHTGGRPPAPLPPDMATCADCVRELTDPADRRHRHPFVSCTGCGPRFSIITATPYDRPHTTMAGFPMCQRCRREYEDPTDRRFHAQPICCPDCGPRLSLVDSTGALLPGDPVSAAAALLRAGQVVAVKGLGGYHLAVEAANQPAVAALRERKHRDEKPFAVMVADLAAAGRLCSLSPADARLLTDPARPIVLLPRRSDAPVAALVAPGERRLGLLLPYTPVHHLLLAATAGPIVLTSGNRSEEPIARTDEAASTRLRGIADAFLRHDRPIYTRTDDSVAHTVAGRPQLLRRSRGYVPRPVPLPMRARRPVLGCGAELKNTFCLASGTEAHLSPHIGDLTNYPTLRSYTAALRRLRRLLGLTPQLVAHDLHPDYLSTKYAVELLETELPDATLVPVQHHHAHIAACLADNAETGPVLGVALDGTGYGTDATLWGGELLVADLVEFQRVGGLAPVPQPGGASAIRQPWRMAVAYLDLAYEGAPPPELAVLGRHPTQWPKVRQLARTGGGATVLTSSAGRLFDAVAAILGVREEVNYEGQAAIALEQIADPYESAGYPIRIEDTPLPAAPAARGGRPGSGLGSSLPDSGLGSGLPGSDGRLLRLSGADLIRAAAEELRRSVPVPVIAARFHHGLAGGLVIACRRLRERTGLETVALSGGVFQNRLLLTRMLDGLRAAGFRVLTHAQVPPNDGGISLGQVAVAAARGPGAAD